MEQLAQEPQETSGRPCHVNIWQKYGSFWSWVLLHGMAFLWSSGKRVDKGTLQNFGQLWDAEFTEVCDASWERKHIRMMLHKMRRGGLDSSILLACSLLHVCSVYLVLVSFGPWWANSVHELTGGLWHWFSSISDTWQSFRHNSKILSHG